MWNDYMTHESMSYTTKVVTLISVEHIVYLRPTNGNKIE